ncbi:hypothetical protein GALAXY_48 [Arthrobacter phage Galaxy]|uniref:Uncharacterized protein n=1 Tax=Arthrobacter phage Galaxy TaxID=1772326 RepID=A0A0U4JZ14_9CAUD|nr:hypothetical protein FDG93_gp48 [Arthrobacter phage Galaxy]ALY08892.1 hypothetical protein GALAXY_48 [Arthrobacter phage Galaxy]
MSVADRVAQTVDAGAGLVQAGFESGVSTMRQVFERALAVPGGGMALVLASPEKRKEAFDELEQEIFADFRKGLQDQRARMIADVDQKAAGL